MKMASCPGSLGSTGPDKKEGGQSPRPYPPGEIAVDQTWPKDSSWSSNQPYALWRL